MSLDSDFEACTRDMTTRLLLLRVLTAGLFSKDFEGLKRGWDVENPHQAMEKYKIECSRKAQGIINNRWLAKTVHQIGLQELNRQWGGHAAVPEQEMLALDSQCSRTVKKMIKEQMLAEKIYQDGLTGLLEEWHGVDGGIPDLVMERFKTRCLQEAQNASNLKRLRKELYRDGLQNLSLAWNGTVPDLLLQAYRAECNEQATSQLSHQWNLLQVSQNLMLRSLMKHNANSRQINNGIMGTS